MINKCDVKMSSKKDKDKESSENDGQQCIKKYAYELKSGRFTLHAYDGVSSIKGQKTIVGFGYDGTPYLFAFSTPIKLMSAGFSTVNYNQEVDFVVKSYDCDAKYSEARFAFDELTCFCPPTKRLDDLTNIEKPETIKSFNLEVDSVQCLVELIVCTEKASNLIHPKIEAKTTIRITFPETDDFAFLKKLYLVVDYAFSFICNRRNTTCLSMRIVGKRPIESIKKELNGKLVPCDSEVFFFDRFREEPEDEKEILKTRDASFLIKYIDKLFQLIAQDSIESENDSGTISILSIHPSIEKRQLIDLQQTLQITAAFEFYVRKYLPAMIVEKEHHIKMREYLENIENSSTGKLKELAKRLKKMVLIEPSLKDKVQNAYDGYEGWESLELCISDEWYKKDEIIKLAQEINDWRNELAHEKREYIPQIDTIRAVQLLEHLNYAIVLRQIGCSDCEIQCFLEKMLNRSFTTNMDKTTDSESF